MEVADAALPRIADIIAAFIEIARLDGIIEQNKIKPEAESLGQTV